jgi:hypothetical protein
VFLASATKTNSGLFLFTFYSYTPFQMDNNGAAALKQPVTLQLAVVGLVSAAFIAAANIH